MITVYRASAGSGKTYTLTGEYLKLLFSGPGAFRRILAVTFTNKATDEMKTRIIEELYNLSSGKTSDFIALLTKEFHLSEKQVRAQAKAILITILHDYSAFNISTIDSFFQQTMRAFAREIGLQGGYGLEMDQFLVLNEAIDSLLGSLDKPENKELLGWLISFAEDKVENGLSWNLRKDMTQLAKELFKESFKVFEKELQEDLADKKSIQSYKEALYGIIRATESNAKALGQRGVDLLEQYALKPNDFKGGANSSMFFLQRFALGIMKPPSATFLSWVDNVEGMFTAKMNEELKAQITDVFNNGLNQCIADIIQFFEQLTSYYTAKEIIRYYYTLGILNDISARIHTYRKDKNIMLIADTTELLNKVIDGSDAPFIYEKTGVSIDNYMIDEFQDTSGMQWENFRPLIKESLSNERFNLIVGDVKQSIYRFRSSDWTLLDTQVAKDFRHEGVVDKVLAENWRSCRCIVEFNNALFTKAPQILQEKLNAGLQASSLADEEQAVINQKITQAYAKLYQHVPPKFQSQDGHVHIEFLEKEKDSDWKDKALERLPHYLETLQDNGYALRDIAILVRTNNEGARVADTLLKYKIEYPSNQYRYDIISDEALFVASSSAVRFIITLLRYLLNPADETAKQMALYNYTILLAPVDQPSNISNFEAIKSFPKAVSETLMILSKESLYEITEGLIRLFNAEFKDSDQVFVQSFMDMILSFSQKESADLARFLNWWDEKGCTKTIITPDAQDAIRILTVHKSKGLGFKTVIIPFGDWTLESSAQNAPILWCHPTEKPFNQLHLVPVKYGSSLGNTIFAREYYEEQLRAFIDNLNMLYVAFTRAKEELIVCAPRPKKEGTLTGVADLIWGSVTTQGDESTEDGEPLVQLNSLFKNEESRFEYGDWWHTKQKEASDQQLEEVEMKRICSITPQDRLRLRLQGKGLFFDNEQRKHGALMHEVLSKIRTTADVKSSVDKYLTVGIINSEEAMQLTEKLNEILSNELVLSWFDGSWKVLNEVDILFGEGLAKRPDRVMIADDKVVVVDYKFGLKKEKKYQTQIKNYVALIKQMGYKEVTGYLWYVELNEVETPKIK